MCRRQVFDVPPPPPRPVCHRASGAVTNLRRVRHRHRGDRTRASRRAGSSTARESRLRAAWLTCAHFLPVRRARRVLNALLGFAVSRRVGRRAPRPGRRTARPTRFLPHVRALIAAAPVAHADETTARAAGALTYLHVACTAVPDRDARRGPQQGHHRRRWRSGRRSPGSWSGTATPATTTSTRSNTPGAAFTWSATCARSTTPTLPGQSWAEAMVNTLLLANDTAHAARAAGPRRPHRRRTVHHPFPLCRGDRPWPARRTPRGSDPLHAASPHPAATLRSDIGT